MWGEVEGRDTAARCQRFGFLSRGQVDLQQANFRFCQVRTPNPKQTRSAALWYWTPASHTPPTATPRHLLRSSLSQHSAATCYKGDEEQHSHIFLLVAANIKSFVFATMFPHMHVIEHL